MHETRVAQWDSSCNKLNKPRMISIRHLKQKLLYIKESGADRLIFNLKIINDLWEIWVDKKRRNILYSQVVGHYRNTGSLL